MEDGVIPQKIRQVMMIGAKMIVVATMGEMEVDEEVVATSVEKKDILQESAQKEVEEEEAATVAAAVVEHASNVGKKVILLVNARRVAEVDTEDLVLVMTSKREIVDMEIDASSLMMGTVVVVEVVAEVTEEAEVPVETSSEETAAMGIDASSLMMVKEVEEVGIAATKKSVETFSVGSVNTVIGAIVLMKAVEVIINPKKCAESIFPFVAMCNWFSSFQRGNCSYGDRCHRSHGETGGEVKKRSRSREKDAW